MKQACHHTSETALPATKQVVPIRSALLACCGTRRGEARVALARLLARPERNRAVGGATRPKHLDDAVFDSAMANHDRVVLDAAARTVGFLGLQPRGHANRWE
ncbi:D-Ala-D-Ala carboxypeptidase family metallohydrolase [Marivita sp.]|uniref:D-Ala-D-Ala carboxypeptidase family metallohydrolase n=1 Tax=Marivita sp. TaxID=2003365 RepID=UPI003F701B3F